MKNQAIAETGHLQKRLGFVFALAIGIGGVIGAGIMRTTGPVFDHVPVIWVAIGLWALGGMHVLLSASELATAIPKAGGLAIVLITILYVALNVSLITALDIEAIRTSDLPIAVVLENIFGPVGGIVAATLGIVLAITCLNASVMGAPRVLYGLGRDGLFLHMATRVNKGGTPDISFAFSLIFSLFLIFSGGFEFIFRLSGALVIFCFILYEASLFALRFQQPDLPRPFKAIGYPYLPAFVLVLDICLLIAFITADPVSGLYMLGLIAICIPVGLILHSRRKNGILANAP